MAGSQYQAHIKGQGTRTGTLIQGKQDLIHSINQQYFIKLLTLCWSLFQALDTLWLRWSGWEVMLAWIRRVAMDQVIWHWNNPTWKWCSLNLPDQAHTYLPTYSGFELPPLQREGARTGQVIYNLSRYVTFLFGRQWSFSLQRVFTGTSVNKLGCFPWMSPSHGF